MASLICGSIAFDTILSFEGRFQEQILPDQIHILNVAFLVPSMRREFGGCAGNIAYNQRLLGGNPFIMATVGCDAGTYFDKLAKHDIATDFIREIPEAFTAQAIITTDRDNNQITAFHPGAMMQSHLNDVTAAIAAKANTSTPITIGIVAPDGRDGMLTHSKQFAKANVPFIFDPGQGLPLFDGKELLEMIDLATYVAVNDYEAEMLCQKTGLSLPEVSDRVEALIVTKGAEGSVIYNQGQMIDIPVVKATELLDPTGCGDSFRAALLFGIENQLDWPTIGRLGSLLGSLKIASQGGQNHEIHIDGIRTAFKDNFGYELSK